MDVSKNKDLSNDSSSDDSSMEEENDAELLKKIEDLENQISENEYNYESHIELVSALRKAMDLDKLRNAREHMAKLFPLSSQLWMDWLEDEIKIATSIEEKLKIVDLFERAIKDYLSVDVWLEYVQFNIGVHAESDDLSSNFDNIRNLFEKALATAGLHVTKGSILWIAYAEFESTVLSLLNNKSNDPEIIETQIKRIANLFKRQLSVPLFDLDETYERAKMWITESGLTDFDTSLFENAYNTSKIKLNAIEAFENKLLKEPDQFRDYLNYEKSKDGSPARAQCLFERLLAEFCLNEQLWFEYTEYLEKSVHNTMEAIEVAKRALRNCPWSSRLYTMYIRLMEKFGSPHEEINKLMEQMFSSGLQQSTDFRDVWMAYLEYMRRRLDADGISKEEENKRLKELQKAFEKATEHLNQMENADPDFSILQFWARIEASYAKNMEKFRDLWSDILSDSTRRTATMFLEYISLEKMYGDSKHLRRLYLRALQQTHDWPESIYASWLNFERDEGTLENYEYCVERCQARIEQVQERRAKQVVKEEEVKKERVRGKKEEVKGKWDRLRSQESKSTVKRKNEEIDYHEISPKKMKEQQHMDREIRTDEIVKNLLQEDSIKDHGETVKHDPSKDDRTVFVSNLDYSTSEDKIREFFDTVGKITDLRLVRDFKGRSKGFCYIEFDKTESALEALKMDRKLIENRPMYVSKCDPDRETRGKGFKFSTNMEKNKLFIKGLNITTTTNDLRTLFEPYGTIKDIRLVTYRNGHSKGLAYVEFEDEISAKQAIMKTDGIEFQEKTISVAISNPPTRKPADFPSVSSAKEIESLGGGTRGQYGSRGKGRTQISLVPRALQMKQVAAVTTDSMENLTIHSPADNN